MFYNIRTLIFQLSFDRLIPTATYLSLSFRYCRPRNEIHTQRECIKTSGSLTYIRTQLFASDIDTGVPFKELKIFRIKRNRLELIDSNRSLPFLQDVPRLIYMLYDDGWTIERNKGHVSRNTFTIEFYNTIQTAWQGSRMLMIVDKADHEMYRWLIHEGSQARHYHGEWKFRYVVIHGEMRSTSFFRCGSREGNARARARSWNEERKAIESVVRVTRSSGEKALVCSLRTRRRQNTRRLRNFIVEESPVTRHYVALLEDSVDGSIVKNPLFPPRFSIDVYACK